MRSTSRTPDRLLELLQPPTHRVNRSPKPLAARVEHSSGLRVRRGKCMGTLSFLLITFQLISAGIALLLAVLVLRMRDPGWRRRSGI